MPRRSPSQRRNVVLRRHMYEPRELPNRRMHACMLGSNIPDLAGRDADTAWLIVGFARYVCIMVTRGSEICVLRALLLSCIDPEEILSNEGSLAFNDRVAWHESWSSSPPVVTDAESRGHGRTRSLGCLTTGGPPLLRCPGRCNTRPPCSPT